MSTGTDKCTCLMPSGPLSPPFIHTRYLPTARSTLLNKLIIFDCFLRHFVSHKPFVSHHPLASWLHWTMNDYLLKLWVMARDTFLISFHCVANVNLLGYLTLWSMKCNATLMQYSCTYFKVWALMFPLGFGHEDWSPFKLVLQSISFSIQYQYLEAKWS